MGTSLIFALCYMLKGGQFPWFHGKLLAAIIVASYVAYDMQDVLYTVLITLAWLLAVSPSMGEEAGAIGRVGYWWGKYKERGFTRSFGVLKGVQRGAWIGAMFSIATGFPALFVPVMAFGFVAAHFIGQEIYYRIHGVDNWKYAEPMVGALIGLCYEVAT